MTMPLIAWVHAARTRVLRLMPLARFKETLAVQVKKDPARAAKDAVPQAERAQLDGRVRGVLLRWYTARTAASWSARGVVWLCGAAAAVVAVNSRWVRHPPRPTRREVADFLAGGVAGGLLALMAILVLPVVATVVLCRVLPGLRWAEGLMAFAATLACSVMFLVVMVNGRQRFLTPLPGDPQARVNGSWAGLVAACLACLALSGYAVLYSRARARTTRRVCRPFDAVCVRLARLVADLHAKRHRWFAARDVAGWTRQLEEIAVEMERAGMYPGRIHEAGPEVTAALRMENLRIAAVFRAHKRDLAQAHSAAAVDEVTASLLNGLRALLAGDRAALLAGAPADVPAPGRLARWMPRLAPAAVFAAAAVLLPLVPLVAESPGTATSLRWTFAVMAAVSLATIRQDVAAQVNEVFSRTVPWEK
ncbi:hypothetical protein [Kitasatospora aureofaciens]|uniref:hypothetical protein n=1 Tax=Kitasatospora aureofaciens TaxID=1894 RepID=UPI0036F485BF